MRLSSNRIPVSGVQQLKSARSERVGQRFPGPESLIESAQLTQKYGVDLQADIAVASGFDIQKYRHDEGESCGKHTQSPRFTGLELA
jgi:hypothetical protein